MSNTNDGWITCNKKPSEAPPPAKRRKRLVLSSDSEDDDDHPTTTMSHPTTTMSHPTTTMSHPTPTMSHPKVLNVNRTQPKINRPQSKVIAVSSDEDESDDDNSVHLSDDGINQVDVLLSKCESVATRIRDHAFRNGLMNKSSQNGEEVCKLNNQIDLTRDSNPTSAPVSNSNTPQSSLVTNEHVSQMFVGGLKLKDYQLVGLNWLNLLHTMNINGILADEMGLGKTIQSIALLALLEKRYGISGPHLIVAPGSTLENWRREIEKWLPHVRVCVYHGSQKARMELVSTMSSSRGDATQFDVLLTTYTYFERASCGADRAFFGKFRFQYTIYDEAHAIKNLGSSRYRRLVKLKTKHRVLLSGTPIQNNLLELLALMSFCMPNIFDAEDEQLIEMFGDSSTLDTKRIRKALAPFILRRLKTDVLSQLSPKKEDVVMIKLDGVQREVYDGIIADYKASQALRSQTDAQASRKAPKGAKLKQVKHIFSQLRKAANHPLLVRNKFGNVDPVTGVDRTMAKVVDLFYRVNAFGPAATHTMIEKEVADYSDWDLHHTIASLGNRSPELKAMELDAEELWTSAKCRKLRTLLPDLIENDHRILLFSQWTSILDIIEPVLASLDIKFVRFDGSTAMADRQTTVDEYNTDRSIKVFLLSTRSGGMGINLTSADTVIIHDLDFNPTVDRQAEDRCHRIGQTKPVTIIKLVSENSVDENILKMQERKKALDERVLIADTVGGGSSKQDAGEDEGESMQNILMQVLA